MVKLTDPSKTRSRFTARTFVAVILLAWGGVAGAGYVSKNDVSESELRLLPRYCPDTMGFTIYGDSTSALPRAKYWVSLMGPSFWHMHHYCAAQISLLRAKRASTSRTQRNALLLNAQDNFQYVIKNATPDFIMLPEIHTRRGETLLLLGKSKEAGEEFASARKIKPDYWPAYSRWAEYLMKNGQRAEALRLVSEGLRYAPDAKVLLEQYRLLGGKLSELPKPVAAEADRATSAGDAAANDESVAPPTSPTVPDSPEAATGQ